MILLTMKNQDVPPETKVIGVAYDSSAESKQALDEALRIAETRRATVRIIMVVPPLEAWITPHRRPDEILEERRVGCARMLENAAASIPNMIRCETVLRDGEPAHAIVDEAGNGVDVLIMGSRGFSKWGHAHESTATKVMRLAPCPVLVVGPGTGFRHIVETTAVDSRA